MIGKMNWLTNNKKIVVMVALILLYSISLTWITNFTDKEILVMEKLRLIPYAILSLCALHTVFSGIQKEGNIISYLTHHFVLLGCGALSIVIYLASHNLHPFVFVVLCVAISDTGFDEYIKPLLIVNVLFMILTILLFKLGMLEQVTIGRSGSDVIRQSLGYSYPLELHGHFFMIVLMYIYIRKEKYSWIEWAMINVMNFVFFHFTNARTDFGIIILLTTLEMLLHFDQKGVCLKYQKRWMWVLFTLLCVLVPFILSIWFDETSLWQSQLNRWLSNRMYIANYVIEDEGLPLFGKSMEWIGFGRTGSDIQGTYNWVDFSFVKDAIDFGLVFVGVFTCGWIYLFFEKLNKKDIYGILIVMILLASCVIEYRSFLPHIYPMILMMAPAIMYRNKGISNE